MSKRENCSGRVSCLNLTFLFADSASSWTNFAAVSCKVGGAGPGGQAT